MNFVIIGRLLLLVLVMLTILPSPTRGLFSALPIGSLLSCPIHQMLIHQQLTENYSLSMNKCIQRVSIRSLSDLSRSGRRSMVSALLMSAIASDDFSLTGTAAIEGGPVSRASLAAQQWVKSPSAIAATTHSSSSVGQSKVASAPEVKPPAALICSNLQVTSGSTNNSRNSDSNTSNNSREVIGSIPQHLAFIVDGNGRWAQRRGLTRMDGHRAGANVTVEVVKEAFRLGVNYITLYLFSTENWSRSKPEVENIMLLLHEYLRDFAEYMQDNKVELIVIGQKHRLAHHTQRLIETVGYKPNRSLRMGQPVSGVRTPGWLHAQHPGRPVRDKPLVAHMKQRTAFDTSSDGSGGDGDVSRSSNGGGASGGDGGGDRREACSTTPHKTLCLAISYGGRDDITQSVRAIAESLASNEISIDDIDEDLVGKNTYLGKNCIPDPDLVVRTSGEFRLSNFLLWNCAYSEFASVESCWPDFTAADVARVIADFSSRERRFGKLPRQDVNPC